MNRQGRDASAARSPLHLLTNIRMNHPITVTTAHTHSVLANHLEEVAIPRVVFVGSHPAEPPHAAALYDVVMAEHDAQAQGLQQRRGPSSHSRCGGSGVSDSGEDSYSYSSSSSPSAAMAGAGAGRGGAGRNRGSGGLRSSSGSGRGTAAVGGAPADVYGEGEGGSPAVVGVGGSPVPGGADATAFVQLAYCLHSGAVGAGGGDSRGGMVGAAAGAGLEQQGRRKQE